jgi:hypothetical protein
MFAAPAGPTQKHFHDESLSKFHLPEDIFVIVTNLPFAHRVDVAFSGGRTVIRKCRLLRTREIGVVVRLCAISGLPPEYRLAKALRCVASRGGIIFEPVDAIAQKLDVKLTTWKPEISREVRAVVSDVIEAADNDALDVARARAVEQEVLDQLDEPTSR